MNIQNWNKLGVHPYSTFINIKHENVLNMLFMVQRIIIQIVGNCTNLEQLF